MKMKKLLITNIQGNPKVMPLCPGGLVASLEELRKFDEYEDFISPTTFHSGFKKKSLNGG